MKKSFHTSVRERQKPPSTPSFYLQWHQVVLLHSLKEVGSMKFFSFVEKLQQYRKITDLWKTFFFLVQEASSLSDLFRRHKTSNYFHWFRDPPTDPNRSDHNCRRSSLFTDLSTFGLYKINRPETSYILMYTDFRGS